MPGFSEPEGQALVFGRHVSGPDASAGSGVRLTVCRSILLPQDDLRIETGFTLDLGVMQAEPLSQPQIFKPQKISPIGRDSCRHRAGEIGPIVRKVVDCAAD